MRVNWQKIFHNGKERKDKKEETKWKEPGCTLPSHVA